MGNIKAQVMAHRGVVFNEKPYRVVTKVWFSWRQICGYT